MRRRTITVAVLAAAAALLAACGGGGEPASTTTPLPDEPPATEVSTPATTELPATAQETEAETGDDTATADDGGEVSTAGDENAGANTDAVIRIENGEPVGGVATVNVKKGDHVRIVVRADAEDELHLHGYEIEKRVGPGEPAIFEFVAEFEGIFELESHHAGALLAKVAVEP